jgi:hypothetical protein
MLAENPHPGALELLVRILTEESRDISKIELFDMCYELLLNSNHNAISMGIRILELQNFEQWIGPQMQRNLSYCLSRHTDPLALNFLSKHPDKINYYELSANPSADAMALLRKYPDRIIWAILAKNEGSCAMALMADYPDRVHWKNLAYNTAPEAIALMEAHPDRVDWGALVHNRSPAAFSLISENIRYMASIDGALDFLSANPNIFEERYDYAAMRTAMDVHREALAAAAFHPRRLARHLAAGGKIDDF